MTDKEFNKIAQLDWAAEEFTNGCYVAPLTKEEKKMNIGAMARLSQKLGRPLTDSEMKKFIVA